MHVVREENSSCHLLVKGSAFLLHMTSVISQPKSAVDQREVKVVPGLVLFETKSLFRQSGMPTLPRKKWLTVFSQVQRTEPSPRGKNKEVMVGRKEREREGGRGEGGRERKT